MRNDNPPIILLPGMAADDRLFRLQRDALAGLTIPAWIEPCGREPLIAYAGRLATWIDPGGPCFVGGASFGGMVALEMAVHLRAEACFLIASIRSGRELPWQLRPPTTGLARAWATGTSHRRGSPAGCLLPCPDARAGV